MKMRVFPPIFLFILLAYLFQVANTIPEKKFATVAPISWSKLENCDFASEKVGSLDNLQRITTSKTNKHANCISEWIAVEGNVLVVEYLGYTNEREREEVKIRLHLKEKNSEKESEIVDFNLPVALGSEALHRHEFRIKEKNNQLEARIELIDNASYAGWVSLRGKLIQLEESQTQFKVWKLIRKPLVLGLVSYCFAVSVVFLVIRMRIWEKSGGEAFIWYFILSVSVFYRQDVFFHMDEWHVIQALRDRGLSAIFRVHNEHFVPLFFLLHAILVKFFGGVYGYYLLFANALHVFNVLVLRSVLLRLFDTSASKNTSKIVCTFLSFIYMFSASNCESLHWVMGQPSILTATCSILSFKYLLEYLEKGEKINLAITLFFALSVSFFYGMGIVLPSELIFITGVYFLLNKKSESKKELLLKSLTAVFCFVVIQGLALATYITLVTRSVAENPNATTNIKAIFDYIIFGGFFATIFRGVGFYPFHSINGFSKLGLDTELFRLLGNWVGFLISSLSLGLAVYFRKQNKNYILAWLIGIAVIFASFILVAPGRARFGLDQAMALRYQTVTLIGLPFILLPIFNFLLSYKNSLKTFTIVSILILSSQLIGVSYSQFLSVIGHLHKLYALESCSWLKNSANNQLNPQALIPLVFEHSHENPIGSVGVVHPSETVSVLEYVSSGRFCSSEIKHERFRNN